MDVVVLLAQAGEQHPPGLHRRLVAAVEQTGVDEQGLFFPALEVAGGPALLQGPVQRPGGLDGQVGNVLLHQIDQQVAGKLAGIPAKRPYRRRLLHRRVASLTHDCCISL